MTSATSALSAVMVEIAIMALAKRNDPLISRINAGETLTSAESKSMAMDLYKLVDIMKTSADVIQGLDEELENANKEIATMKALLGLSDDKTEESADK